MSLRPKLCFGLRTFTATPSAVRDLHFASVFRINRSACHTSKAGKKPLRKCIDRINRNFLPWWSMRCERSQKRRQRVPKTAAIVPEMTVVGKVGPYIVSRQGQD